MKPLHRRTFLRGAAGAALSLPLLESMMGSRSRVRADDLSEGLVNGRIKRFVFVFIPNGVHEPTFFPTSSESFAGTSLEPVSAFRDRTLVLDGLKMQAALDSPGEQHQSGMGALLTGTRLLDTGEFGGGDGSRAGWANGISLDQRIADRVRGTTRFASLQLGVRTDAIGSEVRSRLSYRGPSDPMAPVSDPRQVFDSLFSDMDLGVAERDRQRGRRQRVVDAVQDQFRRVRERVGSADRVRLERHLGFVDELETRLAAGAAACAPGERPTYENSDAAIPNISRAQMDLMVAAFACDLTRVASLQYDTASCRYTFPWLGDNAEGHPLGHAMALSNEPAVVPGDPDKTEATRKWNARVAWHMGEVAYLLSRLAETPDGDSGTLLDSTAVLFSSEISNGHHTLHRLPFVLFGNAGGALRSGVVRYATARPDMLNHNRLLIALQQAYGIDSDVFGEEQYCGGGALDRVLA